MIPFLGLAHVALFTSDMEKMLDFYINGLGFAKVHDIKKPLPEGMEPGLYPLRIVFLKLGELYLEIMEPGDGDGRVHSGIRGAIDHIGIRVSDVDRAIEHLKKYGITQDFGRNVGDMYTGIPIPRCSLTGPEGEVINLYEMDNEAHFTARKGAMTEF